MPQARLVQSIVPPPPLRAGETAERLLDNVATVVRGKRSEIGLVLTALACRGHVLFEDAPGTAKTVLARALVRSVDGATGSRIQCTPDLQPTDVTGLAVFDPKSHEFDFRPGPIFANFVLVDEVNRAMPKTQSALLEAMAECQVTVDGCTRPVPQPFLLLATENPIEHEGTFPLPEAQLDRFFMRISLGYPDEEDELSIVRDQRRGHPLDRIGPVVGLVELQALQSAVEDVYIDDLIQRWIVALVRATRRLDTVLLPASVRGTLLEGRDHVEPQDVERLFTPVIAHRVSFTPSFYAAARSLGPEEALRRFRQCCLELAPRPR